MEREQTSPDYLRTLSPARPARLRGVWREGQALNLKQTINTKLHSCKCSRKGELSHPQSPELGRISDDVRGQRHRRGVTAPLLAYVMGTYLPRGEKKGDKSAQAGCRLQSQSHLAGCLDAPVGRVSLLCAELLAKP